MNAQQINTTIQTPGQLLLEALEKRWKKYRIELNHCRTEFSNEAVHDVRIALRRLLSLTQLLNSISPRPRLRKLDRALKSHLNEFDELRDTQVLLAEITESLQEFPQLQKFQRRLERIEKDLLRDLRKKIKKPELSSITRRVRKTRESLKAESKEDLVVPILQTVDDAFLLTKQRHDLVDPARPATIHRVRVAFKSFRYMVEIIHPLLNEYPEENQSLMNGYQSLMGEIQDLEILIQALEDLPGTASSPDLESVHRYYESLHAQATSAYLDNKDVLKNFWRSSPEKPFPWENIE